MSELLLIGYSGHAFVVCDILYSQNTKIIGYFEQEEMSLNPYNLKYLGQEDEFDFENKEVFIAIGNNQIRAQLIKKLGPFINLSNVIHQSAEIGHGVVLGKGILITANAVINPFAKIAAGSICNTGCIIEHECEVSAFAHIAPGAVLAGNVKIGERSFVGANAVIKQGVKVGNDVIIGAGAVIINDVPDNVVMVGNPGKIIKYNS